MKLGTQSSPTSGVGEYIMSGSMSNRTAQSKTGTSANESVDGESHPLRSLFGSELLPYTCPVNVNIIQPAQPNSDSIEPVHTGHSLSLNGEHRLQKLNVMAESLQTDVNGSAKQSSTILDEVRNDPRGFLSIDEGKNANPVCNLGPPDADSTTLEEIDSHDNDISKRKATLIANPFHEQFNKTVLTKHYSHSNQTNSNVERSADRESVRSQHRRNFRRLRNENIGSFSLSHDVLVDENSVVVIEEQKRRGVSKSIGAKKGIGKPEKIYRCSECLREFSKKLNCQRHIEIVHLNIKKFKCEICSKTFSTKQNLSTHSVVHSKTHSK